MAKRLIPSLNRVLVEKILPPTKTNTGILLPEKASKVFFTFYTMCVNLCLCVCVFVGSNLTVLIGLIGVCSWTQGKWLQWDLEDGIELGIWYPWLWRRVTVFFCLSLEEPKSSLVKKSMFFYLFWSLLVCYYVVCSNIYWVFLVFGFWYVGFVVQVHFV